MTPTGTITVDVHLGAERIAAALRDDVALGLADSPKWLPPKWFYDDTGSALFEQITRLPEYYPTRRERSILASIAGDLAGRCRADTLVELGSGTSEKTRLLLDALGEQGSLERFIPFDVSERTLRVAAAAIAAEYPGVAVHAVVGDFEHHLGEIPCDGSRLIAFLGGTIGNLLPAQRREFLAALAATMHDGDALLLGTDLVKDPRRLVAAYDDAAGVTAKFNKNVLSVLNRELQASFDPATFEHVAVWDPHNEWMEMRLRSLHRQVVPIEELAMKVELAQCEEIRTEVSAKFRREGVASEFAAAGLRLEAWWTDEAGDFALSLAIPA